MMSTTKDRWLVYRGDVWDRKIEIDFPYNPEIIELIKKIPDWWFYPEITEWRIPLASFPEATALLEPKGFQVEKKLKDKLPEIEKEVEKGKKRVVYDTQRQKIEIRLPYDYELIELIRDIRKCYFNKSRGRWRCPLTSLPEVIELLGPKRFHIEETLKAKLPEAKKEREKQQKQWAAKQSAKKQFINRVNNGEEPAFVPAGNAVLTRKLKAREAYEVVKKKVSRYQQVAGIMVLEKDLLEVLSEMGASTNLEPRLCELLKITWENSKQGKDRKKKGKYLSGEYRYMKKGYLLDELCRLASKQETYKWGWKKDPDPPPGAEWVLYFERDGIQCSFHSVSGRGEGPDFPGEWDGIYHDSFPFHKYLPDKEHRMFS